MATTTLYAMLFVGNAVLFYLWSHYILKTVKGECPHCGK